MGAEVTKQCCRDNIVPQSVSDNAPVDPLAERGGDTAVNAPAVNGAAPPPVPLDKPALAAAPSEPKPTSPEDHELDKARLRQLTTEFVQDVIKGGIQCEVLGMYQATREPASYSLDRSLRTFYVKMQGEATARPYKIVQIMDIWIGTEFAMFQKSIWNQKLSPADKDKVVAVQFHPPKEGVHSPDDQDVLLLMESNRSTAVRFVQAMTILRLYNSGTTSPALP
jgi:hypothetical protein